MTGKPIDKLIVTLGATVCALPPADQLRFTLAYVDEEGLLTGKPANPHTVGVLYPGTLAGDALLIGEAWTPDGLDACSLAAVDQELVAHVLTRLGVDPASLTRDGVSA